MGESEIGESGVAPVAESSGDVEAGSGEEVGDSSSGFGMKLMQRWITNTR